MRRARRVTPGGLLGEQDPDQFGVVPALRPRGRNELAEMPAEVRQLAADHDHDTASRRLAAIHTRLRALGHADLADQLDDETRAGTALIVALTCADTHRPDELATALAAFTHQRASVESARTRWLATG